MTVRIGCSGWSYSDWHSFYGPHADKLKVYAARFDAVEVNTSFYGIPERESVLGWLKKTEDKEGFLFSFKAPRDISHNLNSISGKEMYSLADSFVKNCLEPTAENGRLLGVLLQLPPWAEETWMKPLEDICQYFTDQSVKVFIETRSSDSFAQGVREITNDSKISIVEADSPLRRIEQISGVERSKYVRMHGRNNELWAVGSNGMERYRYNYSDEELDEIGRILKDASLRFKEIFVFFNNHPGGNAPRNALKLMEILGTGRHYDRQETLF